MLFERYLFREKLREVFMRFFWVILLGIPIALWDYYTYLGWLFSRDNPSPTAGGMLFLYGFTILITVVYITFFLAKLGRIIFGDKNR
jgi:hypothetical protein